MEDCSAKTAMQSKTPALEKEQHRLNFYAKAGVILDPNQDWKTQLKEIKGHPFGAKIITHHEFLWMLDVCHHKDDTDWKREQRKLSTPGMRTKVDKVANLYRHEEVPATANTAATTRLLKEVSITTGVKSGAKKTVKLWHQVVSLPDLFDVVHSVHVHNCVSLAKNKTREKLLDVPTAVLAKFRETCATCGAAKQDSRLLVGATKPIASTECRASITDEPQQPAKKAKTSNSNSTSTITTKASYWESTEARKLFGVKDPNAITREVIKSRLKVLAGALTEVHGYKILVGDEEIVQQMPPHEVFAIRMKAQYLHAALTIALDDMNGITWEKCCEKAIAILAVSGIKYCSRPASLGRWNAEYSENEAFCVP